MTLWCNQVPNCYNKLQPNKRIKIWKIFMSSQMKVHGISLLCKEIQHRRLVSLKMITNDTATKNSSKRKLTLPYPMYI